MVSRGERTLSYVILLIFALFAVYPFVSTTLVAFNAPEVSVRGLALPEHWSLASFEAAWNDPDAAIGRSLVNSMILAVTVVSISVLLSILTGYAFGTMRFRGSRILYYAFLIGLVVPYEATIIPLYFEFKLKLITPLGDDPARHRRVTRFRDVLDDLVLQGLPTRIAGRRPRRRGDTMADPVEGHRADRWSGDLCPRDDPVHLDLEQPAARNRDDPEPGAADGAGRPQLLRGRQFGPTHSSAPRSSSRPGLVVYYVLQRRYGADVLAGSLKG
jgi:hypothetical protein